ncbi:SRPBCC family protein [Leptospira sarikeiensis]|uniref:SRPBCC domain-containing protein n=1 Tax=Leptospira sarikeiensis TaxID=2484943 RepID=A0A4R9K5S2_9LEPT|nr:SRPBCC domain-containing protein [Leptospira sarikeiensis]TGL61575.1 SRPBCC domain-containing protein [Leptospira sarikeiensis]
MNETEYKDLHMTRTFDAPRDLVWKAWTDPKLLAQWWGPHGFTAPYCELELRVGGKYLVHMQDPEGNINPMNGVIQEINPPEKLVLLTQISFEMDGKRPEANILTTFLFIDKGSQTEIKLVAHPVKVDPELADAINGMEEGWSQTFEKLQALFTK